MTTQEENWRLYKIWAKAGIVLVPVIVVQLIADDEIVYTLGKLATVLFMVAMIPDFRWLYAQHKKAMEEKK